jgi:1,4-alpha-glucan branching enzyme
VNSLLPLNRIPAYDTGMVGEQKQRSLVDIDPWLEPFRVELEARRRDVARRKDELGAGGLVSFASAHLRFGLHRTAQGWIFREYAPHARRMVLVGDHSAWQVNSRYELTPAGEGVWEIGLEAEVLRHGGLYKVRVFWEEGGELVSAERIPPYARRVVQDPDTHIFAAQVWSPPSAYEWRHPTFTVPARAPLIYEAHVGMAGEEPRVSTYTEFRQRILPRIVTAGYNTIQLMAIQEHPYYGSFGYQVSSFFAPSSRFGTPEELMELIDAAHEVGVAVIMDLVHSHAVRNEIEGIGRFDGSTSLYCHAGPRGEHPAWNTRLFDYAKTETLRFLLSNCRYWLETFRFDGFRFDGVTSMLYHDHGLGARVTSYDHYFGTHVDTAALAYLTLAHEVITAVRPDALTIAEEVSAMPGLAAPRDVGGVGFGYRLAMGSPDYWIKLIKEVPDEKWDVSAIWRELTARRPEERTIGYAESHDQALVGDKTIIFRLADKEMYTQMRVTDESLVIDRAMALHKLIRLVTLGTAGHGYLNFMGNEFGHPEWIDFPREGNGWSYHYCRRQWSLRDAPELRYRFLAEFDRTMIDLVARSGVLATGDPCLVHEHVADQVLAFTRGALLFTFNFSPTRSYPDLAVHAPEGAYQIALDTDAARFGGFERVNRELIYRTNAHGRLPIYLPNRAALVFRRMTV